jgi:hypothetical protein
MSIKNTVYIFPNASSTFARKIFSSYFTFKISPRLGFFLIVMSYIINNEIMNN